MMIEKAEQTRNTKKRNNTNHDKRATEKSKKKRKEKDNFVEHRASGAFQWHHCIKKCIMPPTASNINLVAVGSMIQSRHL